jgi:predicted HD superfamily hydrolase involved in NAD metabolism
MKTVEEYKKIIRPFLGDKRYEHSVCVCKSAGALAKKYGADVHKAEIAGILHDIMKDVPPEEQLKMMTRYDIVLSDVERSAQKLWHAMLGAAYLENELQITDRDILNAVRYHTTARENMTLLEKVLFIADFISDDRDYSGVEKMRRAAQISLEEAMVEGITFNILDLAGCYRPIHPDTISAYNQIILKYKQN